MTFEQEKGFRQSLTDNSEGDIEIQQKSSEDSNEGYDNVPLVRGGSPRHKKSDDDDADGVDSSSLFSRRGVNHHHFHIPEQLLQEISNKNTPYRYVAMIFFFVLLVVSLWHGGGSGGESNAAASESKEAAITHVLTLEDLSNQFTAAKSTLYEKLETDYGREYFKSMFYHQESRKSMGRMAFQSPTTTTTTVTAVVGAAEQAVDIASSESNMSWNRLKRRIAIKLLKVLQGEGPPTFIWATGGHSAAASHGNFFNQSYTAYMEAAAKDVFSAVGIEFQGKNYAVGGSRSSPEVAFCQEAIFGKDFDVLSWDYGMTETDHDSVMGHYFYRATMGPSFPATVMFPRGREPGRLQVLTELEAKGATTLYLNNELEKTMFDGAPETFGLTSDQLDALPTFVKNFKCNGRIEEGDPFCDRDKWDNGACNDRRFKTSWHPGWKWHAANGNLMALFLVEQIQDALEFISGSQDSLDDLLIQLEKQQNEDRKMFVESDLPSTASDYTLNGINVANEDRFREMIFKHPSVCHTALLPSDSRYKGILTESDPIDPLEFENSPMLYQSVNVSRVPNDSDTLRLVAEMDERQYCTDAVLNIDHKDYFYIDSSEGNKSLTLPNYREMLEYRPGNESLQGYIAACFVNCDWDNCPPGNVIGMSNDSPVLMQVNDLDVVGMANIALETKISECYMLRAEHGLKFKADDNGRFTIKVQIVEENHYMRFSSFVFW